MSVMLSAMGCAGAADDVVVGRGGGGSTTTEGAATTACVDGQVDVGDDAGDVVCEDAPGEVSADDKMAAGIGDAASGGAVASDLLFRDVWGKPNFLCADLGVVNGKLESAWYGRYRGPAGVQIYVGTCASLSNDPARAAFKSVSGVSGLKCADLPSNAQSVWFRVGQGVRRAFLLAGNCESRAVYSGSAPPVSVP